MQLDCFNYVIALLMYALREGDKCHAHSLTLTEIIGWGGGGGCSFIFCIRIKYDYCG